MKLNSGFCWHILGLCHRNLNNFEEAYKSFKNSLKYDTENVSVLKDAASCAIQLSEWPSAIELRKSVVLARPSLISNWLGLIVAYYCSGDIDRSKRLAECVQKLADCPSSITGLELSRFIDTTYTKASSSALMPPTVASPRYPSQYCPESEGELVGLVSFLKSHYADEHSETALAILSRSSWSKKHIYLASLYKSIGQYSESIKSLLAFLTDNPGERSVRCKGIKYMLRLGMLQQAEHEMQALFSSRQDKGSIESTLKELQYLWIFTERFQLALRKSAAAEALSLSDNILAIFEELESDIFDFHTYVLRKASLESYLDCFSAQAQIMLNRGFRSFIVYSIAVLLKETVDIADQLEHLVLSPPSNQKIISICLSLVCEEKADYVLLFKIGELLVRNNMKHAALKVMLRLDSTVYRPLFASIYEKRFKASGHPHLAHYSGDGLFDSQECMQILDAYYSHTARIPQLQPCSFKSAFNSLSLSFIRFGKTAPLTQALKSVITLWYPNSIVTLKEAFNW